MDEIPGATVIELLKPIIKFCAQRGLKHQELDELLKRAFISVAKESLQASGNATNVSSISAFTGIHRRFITQVSEEKSDEINERINLLTKLINSWKIQNKSKKGKIPKLSFIGSDSEFAKLVASISKDLNPYTILAELERANLVKKTPNGLQLIQNQFIPSRTDIKKSLLLLARDLDLLINSVAQNIYEDNNVKNLHLTTEYDNIPMEYIDQIRKEVLDRGSKFQEDINEYLQQFDREMSPCLQGVGRTKVSVGTFGYIKNIEPVQKAHRKRGRQGKVI